MDGEQTEDSGPSVPTISTTEGSRVVLTQPVVSGVYLLFERHQLVYVGKSTDCYRRIAAHRTNGREFDYALVTPCPEADGSWVESALIKAFEPQKNRAGRAAATVDDASVAADRRQHFGLRVATEPHQWVTLPPEDLMAVSKAKALEYTGQFRLQGQFRAAIESGELKLFAGGGKATYLAAGDLRAWCEKEQRKRMGNVA